MTLIFDVLGDPVPQGSKRAFIVKDRAVVVDANQAPLRSWRSEVSSAARAQMNGSAPIEGPVEIMLVFYLRRPKRPKHQEPSTRPDIDKLARAVLDALTDAGVFRDDSQVIALNARKTYAHGEFSPDQPPSVRVVVVSG